MRPSKIPEKSVSAFPRKRELLNCNAITAANVAMASR